MRKGTLSRPVVMKLAEGYDATLCTKAVILNTIEFGVLIVACGAILPCERHASALDFVEMRKK